MFKRPLDKMVTPEESEEIAKKQKFEEHLDSVEQIDNLYKSKSQVAKELKKLESLLLLNQEKRANSSEKPIEWAESEGDLISQIKSITKLTPNLYVPFIALKGHITFLQLLQHPNSDISMQACQVLLELTDEDAVDFEDEKDQESGRLLVAALVDDGLLELLLKLVLGLREDLDDEKEGVFTALSLLENCCSIVPKLSTQICNCFIPYLLERIAKKGYDSVRGYTAELMAILLQSSPEARKRVVDLEILLPILAHYRKRDPKEDDETEMLENVFDVVAGIVQEDDLVQKFIDQEGIELMLIIIKEKKMARMRAWKVLDSLLTGNRGDACARAFAKKGSQKYKKEYPDYSQKEQDEHGKEVINRIVVSIIYSLFVNLESSYNDRLLFKFIDQDYENLHLLVISHTEYTLGLSALQPEDMEYLDLLDAGFYTLQKLDSVILIAALKSEEIKKRIYGLLTSFNQDFEGVVRNVKGYLAEVSREAVNEIDVLEGAVRNGEEIMVVISDLERSNVINIIDA